MSAVVFGLVYFEGDSWHDGSWELSCPEISVNKWDKTAATERRRNQLDSLVSWGALDFCSGGYRLSGQESATISYPVYQINNPPFTRHLPLIKYSIVLCCIILCFTIALHSITADGVQFFPRTLTCEQREPGIQPLINEWLTVHSQARSIGLFVH